MSGDKFILDPTKLGQILDDLGFDTAIKAMLDSIVAATPLDDETKAAIEGKIDEAVNALVNQLAPELLAKIKQAAFDAAVNAIASGKSSITDDPSSLA